jgi:hypothetical protein
VSLSTVLAFCAISAKVEYFELELITLLMRFRIGALSSTINGLYGGPNPKRGRIYVNVLSLVTPLKRLWNSLESPNPSRFLMSLWLPVYQHLIQRSSLKGVLITSFLVKDNGAYARQHH